jgi:hypothetical protein
MKIDCCCLDVLERENERGFRAASLGELSVVLDEKKKLEKCYLISFSLKLSLPRSPSRWRDSPPKQLYEFQKT